MMDQNEEVLDIFPSEPTLHRAIIYKLIHLVYVKNKKKNIF